MLISMQSVGCLYSDKIKQMIDYTLYMHNLPSHTGLFKYISASTFSNTVVSQVKYVHYLG